MVDYGRLNREKHTNEALQNKKKEKTDCSFQPVLMAKSKPLK